MISFIVIENAWKGEFKGAAADRLLETLATNLTAARDYSNHVNFSAFVNSSGTGKSRVVDELSKRIITVKVRPLNSEPSGFERCLRL